MTRVCCLAKSDEATEPIVRCRCNTAVTCLLHFGSALSKSRRLRRREIPIFSASRRSRGAEFQSRRVPSGSLWVRERVSERASVCLRASVYLVTLSLLVWRRTCCCCYFCMPVATPSPQHLRRSIRLSHLDSICGFPRRAARSPATHRSWRLRTARWWRPKRQRTELSRTRQLFSADFTDTEPRDAPSVARARGVHGLIRFTLRALLLALSHVVTVRHKMYNVDCKQVACSFVSEFTQTVLMGMCAAPPVVICLLPNVNVKNLSV